MDHRIEGSSGGQLQEALHRAGLTRREYEVLRLVAAGQTNPEIAEELGLTRNTVKTYLQSTMSKLGARNRVEAIAKASEAQLL
jgi:DNA-binding NarL/FixJ family response regulator